MAVTGGKSVSEHGLGVERGVEIALDIGAGRILISVIIVEGAD